MCRPVLSLLLPALLAGCAGNAIRLEAAGAVQRDGRAAVEASARYFDAIEQRRRAAAAALVASDPSCLPLTPLRLQVPVDPAAAPAPLCLAGDAPAARGHAAFAIDIADSPRAVLAPRIALLAAVADYVDALAAILDAPKTDVAAELTAFADQAARLARFTNFVAGTDIPALDQAAASERGRSVVALIDFAAALAREARDTRAVRALVEKDGAVVDAALAALAMQVDIWGTGAARTADDLYGNALFRSYLRGRADLSATQREELAARVFAARAAARDGPARAAEVAAAIRLAASAQAGLRAALDGRFTPAQRRAAARLNLDRLSRALGLVAALGNPL